MKKLLLIFLLLISTPVFAQSWSGRISLVAAQSDFDINPLVNFNFNLQVYIKKNKLYSKLNKFPVTNRHVRSGSFYYTAFYSSLRTEGVPCDIEYRYGFPTSPSRRMRVMYSYRAECDDGRGMLFSYMGRINRR